MTFHELIWRGQFMYHHTMSTTGELRTFYIKWLRMYSIHYSTIFISQCFALSSGHFKCISLRWAQCIFMRAHCMWVHNRFCEIKKCTVDIQSYCSWLSRLLSTKSVFLHNDSTLFLRFVFKVVYREVVKGSA